MALKVYYKDGKPVALHEPCCDKVLEKTIVGATIKTEEVILSKLTPCACAPVKTSAKKEVEDVVKKAKKVKKNKKSIGLDLNGNGKADVYVKKSYLDKKDPK